MLRHYRWQGATILDGARIADVFAGTGALGIEAVSNGAAEAWFVESQPSALKALVPNLEAVKASYKAQGLTAPGLELVKGDAARAYARLPQVRVLFCDPPYEQGWLDRILALEAEFARIVPHGLLVFEIRAGEEIAAETPGLRLFDTKTYGESAVLFFVKEA